MVKRIVTLAIFALIVIAVKADTEVVDGIEWTYTISNGEVSLGSGDWRDTAIPQTTSGVVNIPSSLGGYPVTSIGEYAFFRCNDIKSVTIPDSVTSIGYWAFGDCAGLTNVSIPASVEKIASGAFSGCTTIASFFVEVENSAYCSVDGLLLSKDGSILIHGVKGDIIVPDTVTTIGEEAFYGRIGLTSIEIPKSVTNIGTSAFCYCYGLEDVTIPDSVTEIGIFAFSCCESLTSVTVRGDAPNVGSQSFDHIGEGAVVHLPRGASGYEVDGDGKWQGMTVEWYGPEFTINANGVLTAVNLHDETDVDIPDSVTSIGNSAFYGCSDLTSLTIPNSVTSIGSSAFYGCSGLTNVMIGSGVTNIGTMAFCTYEGYGVSSSITTFEVAPENVYYSSCNGLLLSKDGKKLIQGVNRDVVIPDSVTSIGEYAFYQCWGVTNVVIPSSVTNIGYYAFADCRGLAYIIIPDSVAEIGECAFSGDAAQGCFNLTAVVMLGDEPITSFYGSTFTVSPECVVYLPKGNDTYTIEQKKWQGIPVSREFPTLCSVIDGCVWEWYTTNGTEATITGVASAIGAVTIPSTVTEGEYLVTQIGSQAFKGCADLTSVVIPEGVTSIGESAFEGCVSLEDVSIPSTVTRFGHNSFANCPAYEQALYRMVFGVGSSSGTASEVSLTVTNVVVHYVMTAAVSEAVTPSEDTGIVNVIAEVSAGKPVAISSKWAERYPAFVEKFGDDFTAAITKKTGKRDAADNDMFVWQDFVAGTDPTDENDVFTASITFDEDGKPQIAYSPEFKDEAEAAKRRYTTYGKAKLNDKEWTEVPDGDEANYNFFKVTVEMR